MVESESRLWSWTTRNQRGNFLLPLPPAVPFPIIGTYSCGMAKYRNCRQVSSIDAFLSCIEPYRTDPEQDSDLIFRGQQCDWPLRPNLSRHIWSGNVFYLEKLILAEFRRTSPMITAMQMVDDWDRLAVAQHHGLPTRLSDWTYSALASLWFAVKDGPKKNKKGYEELGVVWLMKTDTADFINFDDSSHLTSPFTSSRSRIFRPRVIAHRIQAQSGLFVAHAAIGQGDDQRFIPLEQNTTFNHKLVRIPIPPSAFSTIREQLEVCGVHEGTMYPDVDGLCGHLTWRYTTGFNDDVTGERVVKVAHVDLKMRLRARVRGQKPLRARVKPKA